MVKLAAAPGNLGAQSVFPDDTKAIAALALTTSPATSATSIPEDANVVRLC